MLLSSVFLILAAFAIGFASAHSPVRRASRHNGLQQIQKRASGQFTYYAVGMGACGKQNSDGDFVVALNTPSWDGGSHCFEPVTITINGMTTQAQVVDRCESCGPGDLDFSTGLFHFFGGTDGQGVMFGTWSFGSAPTPTTTTTEQPKPSSTSTATSTSIVPSSTSTPPPSTTSPPPSASSPSSSPAPSSTSGVAAAVPTGVLAQSLFVLGALGELVLAGGNLE